MSRLRTILIAGASLAALASGRSSWADGVTVMPVPPAPSPAVVDAASYDLGNPLNKPVTGAVEVPAVVGGERPPSLEARFLPPWLEAARWPPRAGADRLKRAASGGADLWRARRPGGSRFRTQ